MLDHEDSDAKLVADIEHEAGNVLGLFLVHARDHLVEQQQLRLAGQRACEFHALLLAVGELAHN